MMQSALFAIKFQYLLFFNIAFKMVVNPYRCAPRWTASVKQIACTQREILADIRDDFIDFEEHIA